MSVIKKVTLKNSAGATTNAVDLGAEAENIDYDNSSSGLTADDAQSALDEVVDKAIIQVTTMPIAAATKLGKVYQYIGATTTIAPIYTHNYFYECISDGETPPTYSWEQKDVQPSGGDALKYTIDGADGSYAVIQNATENGTIEGEPFTKNIATGIFSHAEGIMTSAVGFGSHAEGILNLADGISAHAEGNQTIANGNHAHAEGSETTAFDGTHAEGTETLAFSGSSHAEGQSTTSHGINSHAEGQYTYTAGIGSHAEGYRTCAVGKNSHAEGAGTTDAHTVTTGIASHAEGVSTSAVNEGSHAEGFQTSAAGQYSHTQNDSTIAQGKNQTVIGKYNIAEGYPTSSANTDYAFIIGNGTSTTRSNALAVQWDGQMTQDNGATSFKFGKDANNRKGFTDENNTFKVLSLQVETLPTATADNLGQLYQYIGATTTAYTHNYFYECMSDGEATPTYSWERKDVQPTTILEKAVVIGDSFFDGGDIGYNFANYLRAKNIYKEVVDYAEGGTGFGHTYTGKQTLYEKLQNAQMRKDITEADVIYMHLGGNDILSATSVMAGDHVTEPDILATTQQALAEIYSINPNLTIYYIPPFDYDILFDSCASYALRRVQQPRLGVLFTQIDTFKLFFISELINVALLTASSKIYFLDTVSSKLIKAYHTDGLHPTLSAANSMFEVFIHGNYNKNFLEYLLSSDFTVAPDTLTVISSISPSYLTNASTLLATLINADRASKRQTRMVVLNVVSAATDTINFAEVSDISVVDNMLTSLSVWKDRPIVTLLQSDLDQLNLTNVGTNINLAPLEINKVPITDGNYGLKVEVNSGIPTYSWASTGGINYTIDGANGSYATIQNAVKDTIYGDQPVTKNVATGYFSHAEGLMTSAIGAVSHAEGINTRANEYCHAEGGETTANGWNTHAEGKQTLASEHNSHAEGNLTIAINDESHAEGYKTTASGTAAHAEGGYDSQAAAMGLNGVVASGSSSHAEGIATSATAITAHAEGMVTCACNGGAHAEGSGIYLESGVPTLSPVIALGSGSHAEGVGSSALYSGTHAEGMGTCATKWNAHAEGYNSLANGDVTHAEGNLTTANGNFSHSEGTLTYTGGTGSHAEGSQTTASSGSAHAEGGGTIASGPSSHAEGSQTTASGNQSHVEGRSSIASGEESHAEGTQTKAIGNGSHAEGYGTCACGFTAHVEGYNTYTLDRSAHAEGYDTTAMGIESHAEGYVTCAVGIRSHAQNRGTIAQGAYQTAIGYYNVAQGDPDSIVSNTDYAFIIGNGNGATSRSNALAVRWDGALVLADGTVLTVDQLKKIATL